MAIPSTTVWEVRATGSDNNGGAFDPVLGATSLDYSQQDASQQVYTDLVIDGVTNTKISSVTRNFQATDVGNSVRVTGGTGFTVGTYIIVSVASGVATMDRAVGTIGSTSGTGNLGGALAAPATAFSRGVNSNTFYLKAAFTTATTVTCSLTGTSTAPLRIIGYQVTRTDGLVAMITSTNAVASPVLDVRNGIAEIRSVKVDSGGLSNLGFQVAANSGTIVLHSCQVANFLQRGFNSVVGYVQFFDCLAMGGAGGAGTATDARAGFVIAGGNSRCARCVSRAGSTNGFASINLVIFLEDCVVDALTQEAGVGGHAVQLFTTGDVIADHLTVNNVAGSGIWSNQVGSFTLTAVQNSLFATISRYAFESVAPAPAITSAAYTKRFKNNAFYNVTLGRQLNVAAGEGELGLTASPFNSATDLGLNAASSGGALARQAGVPGVFSGLGVTTGYPDVGAVQASASSGGGSAASAAISLWRELTNERNITRVPDATVVLYIQAGLEALNRRIRYHYTDDTTTVALVAGTQEYSLPADFLEIIWVEHAGRELKKSSIEQWRREARDAWRRETATEPLEYAVYANKVILRPAPSAAAVAAGAALTVRYVSTPPDFGTFGFDQLLSQDFRIVVYWAVAEWSSAYPDSGLALQRRDFYRSLFDSEAQLIAEYYAHRSTQR